MRQNVFWNGNRQSHEQDNALTKGDGGAVGLTEQESAFLRWMVAGPEVCRLAAQYERLSGNKEKCQTKCQTKHLL